MWFGMLQEGLGVTGGIGGHEGCMRAHFNEVVSGTAEVGGSGCRM